MSKSMLASAEDCRPLYDLMDKIRALAPWEWMEEQDLFGVQDPESGELGFVSVMGMAGEYRAISLYLGARGLYGFWHIQEMAPLMDPQDLLNQPQLQASFDDREFLEKHDRDIIKQLGRKYRGRGAWPSFRSFRPGYAPWYIERAEARFLTHALEQVLEVAPRVRDEGAIFLAPGSDDSYLVRVAEKQGDALVWRDTFQSIEPPELTQLMVKFDAKLLEKVKALPRKKIRLEADFFMIPALIGERGERPYYAYVLLMVETQYDMVVGMEVLSPVPSLEQMYSQVGITALQQLAKLGFLPSQIDVRENVLYGMLMPFAKPLNLNVRQTQRLPRLDRARRGMMMNFTER